VAELTKEGDMDAHATRNRALKLVLPGLAAAFGLGLLFFGLARSGAFSPDDTLRLPPEKQAILERERQFREGTPPLPSLPPKGEVQPGKPGSPPEPTLEPALVPRKAAGAGTIIEDGQAPISSMVFSGRNRWYEVKGDEKIAVYAGADGQDPSQGVLIVVILSLDETTKKGGATYRSPIKDGALSIVGAEQERLTLVSEGGTTFIFDVAARQFVFP